MMDKGSPLLYTRIGLQGVEWIFSLSVFSVLAARFFVSISVVSFLVAWGVIGWLLYTAMPVLTLLYLLTSFGFFTARIEFIAQTVMSVVLWFVGACVASARIVAEGSGAGVIALFWLLFVASVASSIVSFYDARGESSEGGGKTGAAPSAAVDDEL